VLDGRCIVNLANEGERLFVDRGRELRFRAAPDGPTLREWHTAILDAARARSCSFAHADDSGHAPLP
jgi:hypothetical protein